MVKQFFAATCARVALLSATALLTSGALVSVAFSADTPVCS
jgi:hypothetical protein